MPIKMSTTSNVPRSCTITWKLDPGSPDPGEKQRVSQTISSVNEPYMRPYLCPVCDGRGALPRGFYGCPVVSTTDAMPEMCRSCQGTGIVWR